jgi:hypothetical protein
MKNAFVLFVFLIGCGGGSPVVIEEVESQPTEDAGAHVEQTAPDAAIAEDSAAPDAAIAHDAEAAKDAGADTGSTSHDCDRNENQDAYCTDPSFCASLPVTTCNAPDNVDAGRVHAFDCSGSQVAFGDCRGSQIQLPNGQTIECCSE